MADVTQALDLVDRDRLSIIRVVGATFRIIGRSPLLFLLFGLASQAAVVARLIFIPPIAPKFDTVSAIVLVVNLLLLFFVQTVLTYLAVRLHDEQRAPLDEALALGLRRFLPMLGTTLLVIFAVYAGLIALVVPGVILAVMYAAAVPVCAVEGLGPIASLKRSAFLTKGERWRIFGFDCIFFVPLIIVSGVSAAILTLRGHLVAGQWINLLIQIVWIPLATVFSAAIYVELRRLKENVGVARIFE